LRDVALLNLDPAAMLDGLCPRTHALCRMMGAFRLDRQSSISNRPRQHLVKVTSLNSQAAPAIALGPWQRRGADRVAGKQRLVAPPYVAAHFSAVLDANPDRTAIGKSKISSGRYTAFTPGSLPPFEGVDRLDARMRMRDCRLTCPRSYRAMVGLFRCLPTKLSMRRFFQCNLFLRP